MKKAKSFYLLVFVLSISLVACGGTEKGVTTTENEKPSETGDRNDAAYTFQIGLTNPEGSPEVEGAHKFAELVAEKSDGQIRIEVFSNGALGGERDMLEGMKMGAPEMVVTGDAVFGMFTPQYTAFTMPFLIEDTEHLDNVLLGEIGEEVNEAFHEVLNAKMLSVWHRGPRNLSAKREIKTPDDLNHMKLRVPETPMSIAAWEVLGANPTPMAFTELFVALEQNTVEGQENPLELIYNAKFYEVQSHVMLTEHLVAPFLVMMNNDKFNELPENLQNALLEALEEARLFVNDLVADSDEKYIELLKEEGVEIVEVDRDAFKKKIEESGLAERFEKEWASNIVERIRDAKE